MVVGGRGWVQFNIFNMYYFNTYVIYKMCYLLTGFSSTNVQPGHISPTSPESMGMSNSTKS
jgi:hypothetical protein